MRRSKYYFSLIYIILVMFLIISVAGVSTFAWFTSNQNVYTTTVNATTGSNDIKLLLGSNENNLSENECTISEVNYDGDIVLYPVSTSDLKTFVAMEGSELHTSYRVIEDDDKYYYHGVFYLEAQSIDDKQMSIYLDQRENKVFEAVEGNEVLNASRFGLIINEQGSILTVTDENNDADKQIENTYIDGSLVEGEKVIGIDESGKAVPVELETKYLDDVCVRSEGDNVVYPDYFYTIETNKIYKCDIYFYLEGTDKDCSDALSFEELYMDISLLGVAG